MTTTATLAPFRHATEHPDYIATKEANAAAWEVYEDAKRELWIWAECHARRTLELGMRATDIDRDQYRALVAARDAADTNHDRALKAWHETRVRLGLKDAR